MLAHDRLDRLQGRVVLAVVMLLKRLVDLGMNVVTAPLEFFAAATGTGGVLVDGHRLAAFSGGSEGGPSAVRIRTAAAWENGRAEFDMAGMRLILAAERASRRAIPAPPRAV